MNSAARKVSTCLSITARGHDIFLMGKIHWLLLLGYYTASHKYINCMLLNELHNTDPDNQSKYATLVGTSSLVNLVIVLSSTFTYHTGSWGCGLPPSTDHTRSWGCGLSSPCSQIAWDNGHEESLRVEWLLQKEHQLHSILYNCAASACTYMSSVHLFEHTNILHFWFRPPQCEAHHARSNNNSICGYRATESARMYVHIHSIQCSVSGSLN